MFESGNTTSIISNAKINDIMKIIKSLEESDLLMNQKALTKQLRMKQKSKKGDFSECY